MNTLFSFQLVFNFNDLSLVVAAAGLAYSVGKH